MAEPRIPSSYHTFLTLIRRLQAEDPSAGRKVLKRRIMNLLDLPPEMDDPYWDEQEFSYLRSSRTRRALFDSTGSTWRCTRYGKKRVSRDYRKSGSDW